MLAAAFFPTWLLACAHHPSPAPAAAAPIAIVPGCPSLSNGHLSWCQWRRAVWAAHLYEAGVVEQFVTTGGAVYTPYVEAEGLRAAMVALGVPEAAVEVEAQALHTDQNVAYTLRRLRAEGRLGGPILMATDRGQAKGMCAMVHAWRRAFPEVTACTIAPIDDALVFTRIRAGLPAVSTPPVDGWVDLRTRERAIARVTGRRRPPSFWVYTRNAMLSPFGGSRPPDQPPEAAAP